MIHRREVKSDIESFVMDMRERGMRIKLQIETCVSVMQISTFGLFHEVSLFVVQIRRRLTHCFLNWIPKVDYSEGRLPE